MICKVAEALKEKGIEVREVLSGVTVQENIPVISSQGIEVKSYFNISNVLDEVCERDFYFGVAQSGQSTLQQDNTVLKQPYFSPFGLPVESASVPEDKVLKFSKECLGCSFELWQEMQKNSGRVLTSNDLPENIANTPFNEGFEILPLLQDASESLQQEQ